MLASRVITLALVDGHLEWRGDHMYALWVGDPKVSSVKVATSTTAQPAAGTGTTADGHTGELDLGAFVYTDTTFATFTPYSGRSATGVQGTPFYTTFRLPVIHGMFDHTTGKPKRDQAYLDGKFALKASDTAGKETDDNLYISDSKTLVVGTVSSPSSIAKTIRIPFGELVGTAGASDYAMVQGYARPGTANVSVSLVASVVLPKGVTVTTFRSRLYRGTSSDTATAALSRVDESNGNLTLLKTLAHATTGWSTLSDSVTETVGDTTYRVLASLLGISDPLDARFMWFEFDYTMPDYSKGY